MASSSAMVNDNTAQELQINSTIDSDPEIFYSTLSIAEDLRFVRSTELIKGW